MHHNTNASFGASFGSGASAGGSPDRGSSRGGFRVAVPKEYVVPPSWHYAALAHPPRHIKAGVAVQHDYVAGSVGVESRRDTEPRDVSVYQQALLSQYCKAVRSQAEFDEDGEEIVPPADPIMWYSDRDVMDAVAAYLPTVVLGTTIKYFSKVAHDAVLAELSVRVMDVKPFPKKGLGLGLRFPDCKVVAMNGGDTFVQLDQLDGGRNLVKGTVVVGDRSISDCGGLKLAESVKRVDGVFHINQGQPYALPMYLFRGTLLFFNGDKLVLENPVTTMSSVTEGTRWQIVEGIYTFSSNSRGSGKLKAHRSLVRGEVCLKAVSTQNDHLIPKLGRRDELIHDLSSVQGVRWVSVDRPMVPKNMVRLSVIIDSFACVSFTLHPGVYFTTPLAELRRVLVESNVQLPPSFVFRVFRRPNNMLSTYDERRLTIAHALPPNRGQFQHVRIARPWLTSLFGWPGGVAVLHNRVLAVIIVPDEGAESDASKGPVVLPALQRKNSGQTITSVVQQKRTQDAVMYSVGAMLSVYSTVVEACRDGNVSVVAGLFESGVPVALPQPKTRGKGANIDTSMSQIPLEFRRANVNDGGTQGMTPLHVAAESGHSDLIRFLMEKGASAHNTNWLGQLPIHLAAAQGHANCFPALLGTDRAKKATINALDNGGRSPLHMALYNGFSNTSLWLVENGADVTLIDAAGKTPMDLACMIIPTIGDYAAQGAVKNVRLSLKVLMNVTNSEDEEKSQPTSPPADVINMDEIQARREMQPVHEPLDAYDDPTDIYAEELRQKLTNRRTVSDLFGSTSVNGAGTLISCYFQKSALHLAAEAGHARIVSLLLQCPLTDVTAADSEGNTALHLAVSANRTAVVATLLKNGNFDLTARNDKGMTALHVAVAFNMADSVALLLEHATPRCVRMLDSRGHCTLHNSACKGGGFVDTAKAILLKSLQSLDTEEEDEAIPFRPHETFLQKAVCAREEKLKVGRDTRLVPVPYYAPEVITIVRTCVRAGNIPMLCLLHETITSRTDEGFLTSRWRTTLGRLTDDLLLDAFHCDNFAMWEALLSLGADPSAVKVPNGRDLPNHILSITTDQAWAGAAIRAYDPETHSNIFADIANVVVNITPKDKLLAWVPAVTNDITASGSGAKAAARRRKRKGRYVHTLFYIEQQTFLMEQTSNIIAHHAEKHEKIITAMALEAAVLNCGLVEQIQTILLKCVSESEVVESCVVSCADIVKGCPVNHTIMQAADANDRANQSPRGHSFASAPHMLANVCRVKESMICNVLKHCVVDDYATLLLELCKRKYFDAAVQLVQHELSAPSNALNIPSDKPKKTALHYACQYGQEVLVKALRKSGFFFFEDVCEAGFTCFHYAAKYGHLPLIQMMLTAGHPPNLPVADGRIEGSLGYVPLHLAATHGYVDVCRTLLDRGVPVDFRDVDHNTALHHCAIYGQEKVAALLVDHNASIDRCNRDGDSPLLLAAKHGRENICVLLVSKVKNPKLLLSCNPRTRATVAHFAAMYGQTSLMEQVIVQDRQRKEDENKRSRLQSVAMAAVPPSIVSPKEKSPMLQQDRKLSRFTDAFIQCPPIVRPLADAMLTNKNTTKFAQAATLCGAEESDFAKAYTTRHFPPPLSLNSFPVDSLLDQSSRPGFNGLGKIATALGRVGTVVPPTSCHKRAEETVHSESMASQSIVCIDKRPAILALLNVATAERKNTCDDESFKGMESMARILSTLPRYSCVKETLHEHLPKCERATIPSENILTMTCREDGHDWAPIHYAYANGKAHTAEMLRKRVGPPPLLILDDEEKQRAEERRKDEERSRSRQSASVDDVTFFFGSSDPAKAMPPPGPEINRRYATVAPMVVPPPPPPEPLPLVWFGSYYAEITRKMRLVAFDKWDTTTTETLFRSWQFSKLFWLTKRGMVDSLHTAIKLIDDVDTIADHGFTLLMVASYFGQVDVVRVLIDCGAKIDLGVKVREGNHPAEKRSLRPLHMAAYSNSLPVVNLLLASGADPNVMDECGNTPLHYACARKHFELAKILLKSNASIDIRNNMNETVVEVSKQQRDRHNTRLIFWWGMVGRIFAGSGGERRAPLKERDHVQVTEWDEWLHEASAYHRRLDMLHQSYLMLMCQREDDSVPCLLYNKICRIMDQTPSRSVLTQMKSFWWPEEVRIIDLGGIYIGPAGIATVLAFLNVLPNVEHLDLSGNRLQHQSVEDLCKCAAEHPGLRKLTVSNNKGIAREAALLFIHLLNTNHRIIQIDVLETQIELPLQVKIRRLSEENRRVQALEYANKSAPPVASSGSWSKSSKVPAITATPADMAVEDSRGT